MIARAFIEFHRQTCLKFLARTSETDYIFLTKGDGCSSHVGRLGGLQKLTVGDDCLQYPGIAIHELIHAVGFWHEQSRWDRDDHVDVYMHNVMPGKICAVSCECVQKFCCCWSINDFAFQDWNTISRNTVGKTFRILAYHMILLPLCIMAPMPFQKIGGHPRF